jgi:branched-chain amino acid transport system permease protein
MLAQQLINGLMLGAVYTLIALGYSLVMGILGILNLSVSEIFMMGSYFGFAVLLRGYPLAIAVPAAMAGAALLSILVERFAYRPLRDAPVVMPLLSTLGVSIILQNVAVNVWGSDPMQLPGTLAGGRIALGPVSIGKFQVVVILATVALVAAVAFIVQKTRLGRGLRAAAESPEIALILGVPAQRVTVAAFALSGALAGAAGILIGLHYNAITPYVGVDVGLKAIAVMVVGGTTRIWGVLLAGPLMGIAEVLTIAYGGSNYRDMVIYGLMILVLLVRPQGILAGTSPLERQRV